MIRRLLYIVIAAVAALTGSGASAASVSGPIRGVALEYVNGVHQDIDWMLDQINQAQPSNPNPQISGWAPVYSTQVVEELNNMFAADQAAGVNYFFMMIDPRFLSLYCQSRLNDNTSYCYDPNGSYVYPQVNPRLIVAVQNLLHLTNSGRFTGQFKIDLAVNPMATRKTGDNTFAYVCESGGVGDTNNSNFDFPCGDTGDPGNPNFNHNFGNAEEYIYNWLTALVTDNPGNNIGMALLGVQWYVCELSICDGDSGQTNLMVNQGVGITTLWQWKQSTFATNFPGLTASYEAVLTNGTAAPTDTSQATSIVRWTSQNTPNLPWLVASMYISESPGVSPAVYASGTSTQLQAFAQAETTYHSPVPLWIQEFGGSIGVAGGYFNGQTYTAQDQENNVSGTLQGIDCDSTTDAPRFLWVTGNDGGVNGMVTNFSPSNNAPLFEPAWNALSQWYNAGTSIGTVPLSAPANEPTSGMLPGTCPPNSGYPLQFGVTTQPSHGSVSITDAGAGTYTYTSTAASSFWGSDSFQYQWSFGSPFVTVNVTLYSAPVLTVITNSLLQD